MMLSQTHNMGKETGRKFLLLTSLLLFLLSAGLNSLGVRWGLPSDSSWHPDSIAGLNTVTSSRYLFKNWDYINKYPKGHYLLVSAIYAPLLNHWKSTPVEIGGPTGGKSHKVLDESRVSILILISRTISVIMGALTVVIVFSTGRILFESYLAGLCAALAMAFSQNFVFYSHLGNLDVPVTFWFALSLNQAVKAVYLGQLRNYILLGLFSALAVCTKDAPAGYLVGLFISLAIVSTIRVRREQALPFMKSLLLILNRRMAASLATAFLAFALLNDLFFAPSSFINRMKHWVGGPGVTGYNKDFGGQWNLLVESFGSLYYSLGWPLLASILAAVVYCLLRCREKSAFVLAPLLSFYLIVIVSIKFQQPRFFLPGILCLSLPVGKMFSDLLQSRRTHVILRVLPVLFVYLSSLLYCIALDRELIEDSRHRTEAWLVKNVTKEQFVVAMSLNWYAPRLNLLDCRTAYVKTRPKDERAFNGVRHADYLIMTETEYKNRGAFDQKFLNDLLQGRLGFHEVVRFKSKYLYPGESILGFAGWPMPKTPFVSPEIIVLKKDR